DGTGRDGPLGTLARILLPIGNVVQRHAGQIGGGGGQHHPRRTAHAQPTAGDQHARERIAHRGKDRRSPHQSQVREKALRDLHRRGQGESVKTWRRMISRTVVASTGPSGSSSGAFDMIRGPTCGSSTGRPCEPFTREASSGTTSSR